MNSRTHAAIVAAAYGSIIATTVPTSASGCYRRANPTTSAKCGSSGLITFGGESLTR